MARKAKVKVLRFCHLSCIWRERTGNIVVKILLR